MKSQPNTISCTICEVNDSSPITYAVDIVGLSKQFKRQTLSKSSYTTFKSSILNLLSRVSRKNNNVTRVLKNLTLRVPQGSSVGIIGQNGSGKSTLLKVITGIYKPDSGTVCVNGRIAAMLELGAGFHPDFTGRENLYLAGVMHGLSRKEIDDLFAQIVHFADLEDVIDDPVRTYSSGMFMRLGFSLAVHTNPDILIVDEVLAVGDAAFVNKCKEKLAKLRKEGKTLILVTHDLDAVIQWCDEALWLHDGGVRDRGEPRRVIDHYREFVEKGEEAELRREQNQKVSEAKDVIQSVDVLRWGSREIEITSVRMKDFLGDDRLLFTPESKVIIEIDYALNEGVKDVVFGIAISRSDGLQVHGSNTDIERISIPEITNNGTVKYSINRLGLLDGTYSLDVAVHSTDGYPYDYHKSALTFVVRWPLKQVGLMLPVHTWSFEEK